MSDPTAPLADTPASTTTSDTPDVPWQKRYEDIRPEFDKTKQELATERGVWEDKQAALARLAEFHPDLFEDDEDDEDLAEPDENERPLTRAEFKAWEAEQQQKTQQQAGAAQFEADLKTFTNGRDLSKYAERAIRFAANQGDIKTPDDLKKAVDEVFEHEDSLKGKPRPRVPHVPTNGQAGTDVPNWDEMSRGDQARYMAEKVRGGESQT